MTAAFSFLYSINKFKIYSKATIRLLSSFISLTNLKNDLFIMESIINDLSRIILFNDSVSHSYFLSRGAFSNDSFKDNRISGNFKNLLFSNDLQKKYIYSKTQAPGGVL